MRNDVTHVLVLAELAVDSLVLALFGRPLVILLLLVVPRLRVRLVGKLLVGEALIAFQRVADAVDGSEQLEVVDVAQAVVVDLVGTEESRVEHLLELGVGEDVRDQIDVVLQLVLVVFVEVGEFFGAGSGGLNDGVHKPSGRAGGGLHSLL